MFSWPQNGAEKPTNMARKRVATMVAFFDKGQFCGGNPSTSWSPILRGGKGSSYQWIPRIAGWLRDEDDPAVRGLHIVLGSIIIDDSRVFFIAHRVQHVQLCHFGVVTRTLSGDVSSMYGDSRLSRSNLMEGVGRPLMKTEWKQNQLP